MEGILIPILVFLIVYVIITFELIDKAVASIFGVAVLLVLGVVDQFTAIELIDFETIMLLLGMMIIVVILKKTGFFSLVAVKIAEMTKGNPLKILLFFSIITAVLSAFLNNVTTILIIVPIIIELTVGMGLDPKKYVISQALVSNIAGTATLVGDPPNMIIGSKVGLTFNQFMVNLIVPVLISIVGIIIYIWFTNRKVFSPINNSITKLFSVQLLLEKIRFEFLNIKIDKTFMMKSLICLLIAILLFITQAVTKISPGVVALSMAMILFMITKVNVEKVLEEIEWNTLLFFAGLFILVGVLEEYGVIQWIAENIFLKLGDNPYVIVLAILWISGIVSGFLDNIPFTIAMIPIIQIIMENTPVPNNILWWALALGACFGGNLTVVGASSNIVAVDIAKKYDQKISFFEFMKTGATVTVISLVISSIYLMIYLRLSL